MKEYTFAYGSGQVSLRLDEKQVLGVLRGHETPPIGDIPAALRGALDRPIGCEPLDRWARAGEKVALIVSDLSRFWMRQDLVVPHLIGYLNTRCGIPDGDITIVIACGTHAGGDESELRRLVTDAAVVGAGTVELLVGVDLGAELLERLFFGQDLFESFQFGGRRRVVAVAHPAARQRNSARDVTERRGEVGRAEIGVLDPIVQHLLFRRFNALICR